MYVSRTSKQNGSSGALNVADCLLLIEVVKGPIPENVSLVFDVGKIHQGYGLTSTPSMEPSPS